MREKQKKGIKLAKINKQNKGITLVALVVTIVVLIILATVSINAVVGENGLIQKAKNAKGVYENSVEKEQAVLDQLESEYDAILNELVSKPLVTTVTTTDHETIEAEDTKGNQVVVPGGFKLAEDSGTSVQQGIVIQDDDGNQFVWVPVSNINHDGSNKIKLDDNREVEITLGRYTFDTTTGVETKVQYGSEYAATTLAAVTAETVTSYGVYNSDYSSYSYELTEFRESNQVDDLTGTNATAKNLAKFITSVSKNKGYYLARYEASYALGSSFGVGDNTAYYKPASKVSTAYSTSAMDYTAGTLWNYITQGNASKASRQMYYGDNYVESDLCNSYAWDTAIVYIQAMGNEGYAFSCGWITGNTTLKNTGATTDQKCKIYDMAANLYEWTTEYSPYASTGITKPCTIRGGIYADSFSYTNDRGFWFASLPGSSYSFHPLLYVK